MALKKLLNKGTVYKRNDNRWGGMVSYHDEQGVYRRKSFCYNRMGFLGAMLQCYSYVTNGCNLLILKIPHAIFIMRNEAPEVYPGIDTGYG